MALWTYMMSGMGFGQMAYRNPGQRQYYLNRMEVCIEKLLSREVKSFDIHSWGHDPFFILNQQTSDTTNESQNEPSDYYKRADHAAYLGYLNLLLSFHRYLDKNSRFASINDQISHFLAKRLRASPLFLLYTYPDEMYVVDNCAVIGSLGLYGKATNNTEFTMLVSAWLKRCRADYVDQSTGLLFQSINEDGKSYDSPRGSGTTLGIYFLSFADINFSHQLYTAVQKELMISFAGFLAVREYPSGISDNGDIDSGPVVLGMGFSATGFSIAGAKIFKDKQSFKKLCALTYLFGTPRNQEGSLHYLTGGPLGTSIMFAVLTAIPEEKIRNL